MDLETGGVIGLRAVLQPTVDNLPAVVRATLEATRHETRLPLLLTLPSRIVLGGPGALAPLHEALRAAGRRPGEIVLMVRADFPPGAGPAVVNALAGLRAVGYLVALGDLGGGPVPLETVADASPYLVALSPGLIVPGAPRRAALTEALVKLCRVLGTHLLATDLADEQQLVTARSAGIRLADGPALRPDATGRVPVPLAAPMEEQSGAVLGPRVQELLVPAVTLPEPATSDQALEAFAEPTTTSVILVDDYQRPVASLDRNRFLLSFSSRYGHALHGSKPALRLADPPRAVPKTTPAIAAMQLAGRDSGRAYDDLVVTDELGRCMGIVRVSDLMRELVRS